VRALESRLTLCVLCFAVLQRIPLIWMSVSISSQQPPSSSQLVVEVVAGSKWRGSLFVTDIGARVIAEVGGAFGGGSAGILVGAKGAAAVKGRGGGIPSGDAYVAAVLSVLMDSIPVLPKELARLMVSYARPTGMRRIAGAKAPDSSQQPADGPALNGTLLSGTTGIAVDLSDTDGQAPL
jgi:hypothetical protein